MLWPPANDADTMLRAEQRLQAVAINGIQLLGAQSQRHQQHHGFPVRVCTAAGGVCIAVAVAVCRAPRSLGSGVRIGHQAFVENVLNVDGAILGYVHV